MIKARIIKVCSLSLLVCSIFSLCTALGMLFNPDAFHKFFSPVQLVPDSFPASSSTNYYWDVRHYAEMVLGNRCTAFYPLWPLLIRLLFQPQNLEQAAYSLLNVSTIIFFVSTPFLVWIFIKALKNQSIAFLSILAFTINPMAIFRVIGYTESLFSALSIIFIWLCLRQTKFKGNLELLLLFLITLLLSLNRPILAQTAIASIAALVTIYFFECKRTEMQGNFFTKLCHFSQEIKMTIILWVAAITGYSFYGFYCLRSRGNFFAPFLDQKPWSSDTGLHLELLLFPKSPLFDLLGLYFPILVLALSLFFVYCKVNDKSPLVWVPKFPLWNALFLYPPLLILSYAVNYLRLKKKSTKTQRALTPLNTADFTKSLSRNYIFWFCVYFPVIHAILILLTRDRLYSLGRHIFGIPFFFLALGYLCCCIPGKKTYQTLWWLIVISAIALVEQWVNYGQNQWLG